MFFKRKKKQRNCANEDIDFLLLDLSMHYEDQDQDDYYEAVVDKMPDEDIRILHRKIFGSDENYYPRNY